MILSQFKNAFAIPDHFYEKSAIGAQIVRTYLPRESSFWDYWFGELKDEKETGRPMLHEINTHYAPVNTNSTEMTGIVINNWNTFPNFFQ